MQFFQSLVGIPFLSRLLRDLYCQWEGICGLVGVVGLVSATDLENETYVQKVFGEEPWK